MKKILTLVACLLTLGAMAQEEDTVNKVANIDWNENVDELKTVDDLVKERQDVANRAAREEHMKKIWANHGYFHIAWHTVGNLDPQETCLGKFNKKKIIEPGIKTGMGDELVSKYERDWGVSIIAGKNIKLHSPIADILQFNLDFTGVDININHFKGSKKTPIYDSGYKETDKKEKKATNQFTYYDKNLPKEALYSHWNAEQYEAGYGMNLGPSITIAPFSRLYGAKELHFLKFNFYYHIINN